MGKLKLQLRSELLDFLTFSVYLHSILNITESVGDRIVGYEGHFTLVAPAMALSVVDVVPDHFDSLYFGVTCDLSGINPEVRHNSQLLNIK